nr:A-kinase anchor protein 14 isoform X2 [Microcebus murinus]
MWRKKEKETRNSQKLVGFASHWLNWCCPGSTRKHSVWESWGKAAWRLLLRLPQLPLLLLQTRIWLLRQKKMNEPKNVKIQKTVKLDGQDDSKVTAIALAIVKDVIDAAVKFVEDADNPIKNIKWITHGEFTAERGRKQIEQFVLVVQVCVGGSKCHKRHRKQAPQVFKDGCKITSGWKKDQKTSWRWQFWEKGLYQVEVRGRGFQRNDNTLTKSKYWE